MTLEEIYRKLDRYVVFDIQHAMEIEVQTELSLLQANPYMMQVYQMAVELEKPIIAVSDMYLPTKVIEEALKKNGYTQISRIFLSQECGFSKRSGRLFPYVREQMGAKKKYLHFGDNYTADLLRAKAAGFDTRYYTNVNRLGNPHRCMDLSCLDRQCLSGIGQ